MRLPATSAFAVASFAALAVIVAACGSETATGTPCTPGADASCVVPGADGSTGGGDGSTAGDGAVSGDGAALGDGTVGGGGDGGNTFQDSGTGVCVPINGVDGGVSPQCGDCIDNDGDGLIDSLDPECSGPLDNDEKTFGTGIPGDNMDACKQDCFFDGNSGQGDDGCDANLKCDPANTLASCPYDPSYKNCPTSQSQRCINFCGKLTPNGCDCFGCCTVPLPGGGSKSVRLSSTCSIADINDPTKCQACTVDTNCQNTCQTCEICIGKPTIPASCYGGGADGGGGGGGGGTDGGGGGAADGGGGGGTGQICAGGEPVCNGVTPCPAGLYCLTGCCIAPER